MDPALKEMTERLFPQLAGRVIYYDQEPPDIDEANPVYAVVRAVSRELGYLPPGMPTGRSIVNWTATIHGLRAAVQQAIDDIPGALTSFYHYPAQDGGGTGMLIQGALATGVEQPERSERPAAVAEATITFASEVILL